MANSAKTFAGFKSFTEALDSYCRYTKTKDPTHLENAQESCEKAKQEEPEYKALSNLFYNFGIRYIDKDDQTKAKEMLYIAFELNPEDITPIDVLRAISTGIGFYEEALADVHYLLLEHETSYRAIQPLATTNPFKDYNEILKNLNHALRHESSQHEVLTYRGEIYSNLGRYEEALDDFNDALNIKGFYAKAWLGRGIVNLHKGKCKEAIEDFEKAERKSKDGDLVKYWVWENRGEAYRRIGEYNKALKDFNKAIKNSKKFHQNNNNFLLSQTGLTYSQMTHLAQKYTEKFMQKILANYIRSEESSKTNLDEYLKEEYLKAKKNAKKNSLWSRLRQLPCLQNIRLQEVNRNILLELALNDFNVAIKNNPDLYQAYTDRGITYHLKAIPQIHEHSKVNKQYKQASEEYKQAEKNYQQLLEEYEDVEERPPKVEKELDNAEQESKQAKVKLEQVGEKCRKEKAKAKENLTKALADFDHVITHEPKRDWYYYNRALVYQNLAKIEEENTALKNDAKKDLKEAINIASSCHQQCKHNCRNTFNLALYFLADENYDENYKEAKSLYLEALSEDPDKEAVSYWSRVALNDLNNYQKLFPDQPDNLEDKSDLEEIKRKLKKKALKLNWLKRTLANIGH